MGMPFQEAVPRKLGPQKSPISKIWISMSCPSLFRNPHARVKEEKAGCWRLWIYSRARAIGVHARERVRLIWQPSHLQSRKLTCVP